MTTLTKEEKIAEYQSLVEEIVIRYQYGESFVKSLLLSLVLQDNIEDRNNYIRTLGNTLGIDVNKVKRILELLPS